MDRAAESAGFGPLAPEVIRGLVRIDGLAGAVAVAEAAELGQVVIWNAGEIEGLLRLLALLGASRTELARLVSPIAAMRALQALPADDVNAWQRILDSVEAAHAMLTGDAVRILLVVEPEDGVEDELAIRLGQLGLMRFACDGFLVDQVPAEGDCWPEPWAEVRRQRVDRIRARGVPVVVLPLLIDDSALAAAFESAAGGVLGLGQAQRPLPDRIDDRGDGGYELHVHLPGVRAGDVRVGRIADALVIAVCGMRRQAPLAPVLSRCEIEGAGMRDDWLVVNFARNSALWPEAS